MLLSACPHQLASETSEPNVSMFGRLGNQLSAHTFAGLLLGPAAASGALVSVSISTSDMIAGWTCSNIQQSYWRRKRIKPHGGMLLAAALQLPPAI
jgi:hypothetical protein